MEATMKAKPMIHVPAVYGKRPLARQAYRMGFLKGYQLAEEHMAERALPDGGAYPPAPPEFQGLRLPMRAWHEGCVAGSVQATKDAAITIDLLNDAAEIMDELEAADDDARPHVFVGKDLPSPSELQNEKRKEWMHGERQAQIDHDCAQAYADATGGVRMAGVIFIGVVLSLVGVSAWLLLYIGYGFGK